MGLTSVALKIAAPLPDIESFERYLFIGPHPDDIEIGAGATAAKLAQAGKKVCFLICADGRFGDGYAPDLCPDELAEVREGEAIASAAALGVEDVRFLRLCDGGLYEVSEMLEKMAKVIGDFAPDMIFCPDPDVTSECHIDHLNTGRCAKQLAYLAPYKKIMAQRGCGSAPVKAIGFYMTAKANRFVNTSGLLEKQLDAIFKNHLSQFPAGCAEAKTIGLYLRLRAYDFGLRRLCRTAEGFRVLGTTQMHCLPEAGD